MPVVDSVLLEIYMKKLILSTKKDVVCTMFIIILIVLE